MTRPTKPTDSKVQRQSIYMPKTMDEQLREQSKRLDRSMSWLLRYAWERTFEELQQLPRAHERTVIL